VTAIEREAVAALMGCSFPKLRDDVGFVKHLSYRDQLEPHTVLTFREEERLWRCVWRYRRQIADQNVLARADQTVNGALALRF